MLRVGEWIRWGRRRIEDFHEVYDAAEEATAHVRTLYETGELELMMVALGGGIVVSYIMYVFCCAKRPKSDVKIAIDSGSSGSDSEGFKGTSVGQRRRAGCEDLDGRATVKDRSHASRSQRAEERARPTSYAASRGSIKEEKEG